MSKTSKTTRRIGVALILFAIGFNLPYAHLAATFDYPAILRKPAGEILAAFAAGGPRLILTWAAFTFAALLFAPIAVAVSRVTDRSGSIAALGIAAGVTQAIGLARWVYAVPGLAAAWTADPAQRPAVEIAFTTLHQFAGVGIGEALGQSLTAFWLIGVSVSQRAHPRYPPMLSVLGVSAGIILLLGLVDGLATVLDFDPGPFGLAAMVGFLMLTLWMIWTGFLCIVRPAASVVPSASLQKAAGVAPTA